MKLDSFNKTSFDRGAGKIIEAFWILIQALFFSSALPGSGWRKIILRIFGAKIDAGVVIKPRVRIKFPWRLKIGKFSWIGEAVWIDNLSEVNIGSHCCISQAAYLCTGNHDWSKRSFDLISRPIQIEDQVWLGAKTNVGPGVTMGEGAVLCFGGVATKDLLPWTINAGNPAVSIGKRVESD